MKPEPNETDLGPTTSPRSSGPSSTPISSASPRELHPLEQLAMRPGPMTGEAGLDLSTCVMVPSGDELAVRSLIADGDAKDRAEAREMIRTAFGGA